MRLVAAGAEVVGVDASPDMIAAARALGLTAEVADGHALDAWAAGQAPFDAVFSNAALHWMTDPAAVFRGVARALRPGGRVAYWCSNEEPEFASALGRGGFEVTKHRSYARPRRKGTRHQIIVGRKV